VLELKAFLTNHHFTSTVANDLEETVDFWFRANESSDTNYGHQHTYLVRSKRVVRGSSPNQCLTTDQA
jgi:hypothetical protein